MYHSTLHTSRKCTGMVKAASLLPILCYTRKHCCATFDGRLRRGATPGVGWSRYHRETDCLELSANQCFPISRGQCKGRYQQETYCLHYVFSTTRYSLPHPSQIYSIPSLFQHHSATSIWDNFVPIEIRTKQRKRLCQVDLLMSSEKREPLEL